MSMKATYVPRNKNRKLNLKVLIPLIVLALLLSYVGYSLLFSSDDTEEVGFSMCGLSVYETRELLKTVNSQNNLMMKDYFYYGETLNILSETYNLNHRDAFAGKTVYFTNLCKDTNETTFFLGSTVDNQIYIESLEDGFYSIAIDIDLTRMSLYTEETLTDTYYTVRRNGEIKRIELIANHAIADSSIETGILNYNYLFMKVTTLDANDPSVANIYDVVIDPYGNNADSGSVYTGVQDNGLSENAEMYETAVEMKKVLEAQGLKVLITKSSADEVLDIYGNEGRITKAVQVYAKYYLDLQMNASADTTASGGQIVYSSYSSNRLATTFYKYLKEKTSLPSIDYGTSDNLNGVLVSENNGYDVRSIIRETGGYALMAGSVSTTQYDFSVLNQHLSQNRHGIQTLSLEYLMISNPSMAALWKENKTQIATESANALLLALGFDI